MSRPSISILLPGDTFSWQWVHAWTLFLGGIVSEMDVTVTMSTSNNIYHVRNSALDHAKPHIATADYVLWIDSDNPVTVNGLKLLLQAIQKPEVDAVGGWYYMQSEDNAEVAAGWVMGWEAAGESVETSRPPKELLVTQAPFEIDYIGFGFLLMKADMVRAMGDNPFRPEYSKNGALLPDDSCFCYAAKRKGFKFFLHPQVHVPHLKLQKLTPGRSKA